MRPGYRLEFNLLQGQACELLRRHSWQGPCLNATNPSYCPLFIMEQLKPRYAERVIRATDETMPRSDQWPGPELESNPQMGASS